MDWNKVARHLEHAAAREQDEANKYGVMSGYAVRAERHQMLALMTRILAGAIRSGADT